MNRIAIRGDLPLFALLGVILSVIALTRWVNPRITLFLSVLIFSCVIFQLNIQSRIFRQKARKFRRFRFILLTGRRGGFIPPKIRFILNRVIFFILVFLNTRFKFSGPK